MHEAEKGGMSKANIGLSHSNKNSPDVTEVTD